MAPIKPNVRDFLPDLLVNLIRDRYLAGVADAQVKFPYSEGDEDSLTGALGQAISTAGPLTVTVGLDRYTYNVSYRKLRGRGSGAPEKTLGADGIFQIDVTNNDGVPLVRKGLPFQAKKRWSGRDKKLVEQARKMLNSAGEGLIINFSPLGFSACSAADAIQSEGRIRTVKASGDCVILATYSRTIFWSARSGLADSTTTPFVKSAQVSRSDLNPALFRRSCLAD
jgi:hypothetical protein